MHIRVRVTISDAKYYSDRSKSTEEEIDLVLPDSVDASTISGAVIGIMKVAQIKYNSLPDSVEEDEEGDE